MIQIRIQANHLADDINYRGAVLTLPAGQPEFLDALDAARVPSGSGEYALSGDRGTPNLLKAILKNRVPSLAEMNHLAERLDSMSEESLGKVEGILELRKSYDIAGTINATHNLNRFVQHPVYDDAGLGEVMIENGMYEPLELVPDELIDCLDAKKVGALVRKEDGGVFTGGGYVIQESVGWDEVYDGRLADRAVAREPGDPIVSLLLGRDEYAHSEHDSGWLHCPASEQEIADLLQKTKNAVLDDLTLHGFRCVIPTLADSAFYGASNREINTLAGMIQSADPADLVKYKAICEMENVVDIDTAMSLTTRLDEYDFEPYPSTAAFGRAAMAKTGADVKLLAEHGFDFDSYGFNAMEEQGVQFLSYGFVSCGCCEAFCIDETIRLPSFVLEEAGLDPGCKLEAFVDEGGIITVDETGYDHNLTDVPPDLLEMFRDAGICIHELEERLMFDCVIYGNHKEKPKGEDQTCAES